ATNQVRSFQLTLESPVDPSTQALVPGATASFFQSCTTLPPSPPPSPATCPGNTVIVTVERHSTISRSVFVRSSVSKAQVTVDADVVTNDFINTEFVNTDFVNTEFVNTEFVNTDFVNTEFVNTEFVNTDFVNGALADSTTQVTNTGTTDLATEFSLLKSVASQCGPAGGLKCQLIVHKLYLTTVAGTSCTANRQLVQSEVVANIPNPSFTDGSNPSLPADLQTVKVQNGDRTNVILTLRPKETLKVTFRLMDPNKPRFCTFVNNA